MNFSIIFENFYIKSTAIDSTLISFLKNEVPIFFFK